MRNEFMAAARRAQVGVRSAQQRHEKWRAKADRRFTAAEALHTSAVARAEMTEARAWMDLLAVPGVTIPTAAALMEVSESTVSRWVARYNRGLEEERATGTGGAP